MLVSQGPIKNGLSVIQVFMSVVSGGWGWEGREREKDGVMLGGFTMSIKTGDWEEEIQHG